MLNFVIVFAILTMFLGYEILLSLILLLTPRSAARKYRDKYSDRAIEIIFSTFRTYRHFEPQVENRMGRPFPDRFLLIANHQSLLDIPVIMKLMPRGVQARFMAKKELGFGIPLISMMLRSQGHCLVKRSGDPIESMRTVSVFARRCRRENTCPVVFPEGTRSRTGELGVFHSAGVRKVLETESLPIVVVAVEGGWKTSTLKDFFAVFGTLPYRVRFEAVLPAPQGRAETLDAIARARDIIAKSLEQMRS